MKLVKSCPESLVCKELNFTMPSSGGKPVKRIRGVVLAMILVLVPGLVAAQDKYEKGEKSITERELRHYVRTLASDRYEGRLSGTKYCDKAAKYIEAELKKMKLSELPGIEGCLSEFEIDMPPAIEDTTRLGMRAGSSREVFKVRNAYLPVPFSANAEAQGGVVFAGYGITAPEYEYDDYAGVDAKGKIVIIMRNEPQKNAVASKFKGKEYTKHARFSEKALNAQKHGAAGVVFVTDPVDFDRSTNEFRGLRIGKVEGIAIPVVFARLPVADWAFRYGPKALEYLQKEIDSDCKPRSFEFEKLTAEIRVQLRHYKAQTYNVIACCKGSDPALADEYIVIGAHYDHLGRGLFGLQWQYVKLPVCNGADDNASGTAVVMEMAEAFGMLKKKPKRSVLFVLFSGEERGLLGSKAFVENPPVPIEKIAFMMNFDMVGRSRGMVYVSGAGTASGFFEIVNGANREIRMPLKIRESIGGGSDHVPFYRKKIPVLYFATGMHEDYHKSTDDWDKLNYEDMEKIARIGFRAAADIADLNERPQFIEATHPAERVAYLGVEAEDVSEPGTGALVKEIVAGSPAEKAGVKEGDVVVEFGGRVVHCVEDLKETLFEKTQGEEIEIVILRGEEELRLKIKLGKRSDF